MCNHKKIPNLHLFRYSIRFFLVIVLALGTIIKEWKRCFAGNEKLALTVFHPSGSVQAVILVLIPGNAPG
jgi:hypothetical protein